MKTEVKRLFASLMRDKHLIEFGITGSSLRCNSLASMKSYPLLYLLFIDGLIKEIELSQHGMCIYGMNAACPTVADDMVLISFSKKGLQHLMDMCYRYSLRWRFEYNPSKCSVIVFNESRVAFERCDRTWCLEQICNSRID